MRTLMLYFDPVIKSEYNIYTEAFHHFANRLDFTQLDFDEKDQAYYLLENILQGKASKQYFQANFEVNEKLRRLFFESKNLERIQGAKALGLGYPLLAFVQNDKLRVMPLFLWKLQLQPDFDRADSWHLAYEPQEQIETNKALNQAFPESDLLRTEYIELAKSKKINTASLVDFCIRLASELDFDLASQTVAISDSPTLEALDQLGDCGHLFWSGIIGIYPPMPPILDESVSLHSESLTYDGHSFGLLDLDPFQAAAKQRCFENTLSLVEGGAGCGKTHLLTHLLTNALSNGEKCLIISKSADGLKEIQHHLSQLGINQFNFLLKDQLSDQGLMFELLRAAAETGPVPVNHNPEYFRIVMGKTQREERKLANAYKSLRTLIFNKANWTETVGLYLASNRIVGKELLSTQLNAQDFSFDYPEFLDLQQAIETCHQLYQEVKTLRHPLRNLNAGIFVHQSKEEALRFIEDKLSHFIGKGEHLHARFIHKVNSYADALTNHYEDHYAELSDKLAPLVDKLEDYSSQYGASFEESGDGALKFYGFFSEKHKNIMEAREEVAAAYNSLLRSFEKNSYLDFQFSGTKEGRNIPEVKKNLKAFEVKLRQWRDELPNIVQEEVARMSQKTVHSQLDYKDQIRELEEALDIFIEELNGSGLYQLPLENKMLTIPKRQKFLEELLEQLENTHLNLRDFGPFFHWQKNWFNLSESARKVIKALVKAKPQDWQTAFKSWYLNNCLTNNYKASIPAGPLKLRDYVIEHNKLKPMLGPQISYYWQDRREKILKRFKRENKAAYNTLFNRKTQDVLNGKSLEFFFAEHLNIITEILPIIFAPPHMVDEFIPKTEKPAFDLLLIDDAHCLALGSVEPLLQLAKRVIVVTDPGQENVEDISTLVSAVRASNAPVTRLETIHRLNPGNLTQLPNGVMISDQALGDFQIHFEQIGGRYDENKKVNDVEAQQVIRLLNQIRRTPQRTYPKVGIACFTFEQRDLISDYLLKIKQKQQPGYEKIQHLERNGLGIFHLSELYGQHYDILVISGTYGPTDLEGTLPDRFELLNSPMGVAHLNLLMSRALKEIFLLNSIPEDQLEEFVQDKNKLGFYKLAHYYAYAKAIEQANPEAQKEVTEQFKIEREETTSVFLDEVALSLKPYLQPGRVQRNSLSVPFNFPLLVDPIHEKEPPLAVRPDGFFANTYATDFSWEYQQKKRLEKSGYIHYPIWSVNWWKNSRKESRKLASAIIKVDEEHLGKD